MHRNAVSGTIAFCRIPRCVALCKVVNWCPQKTFRCFSDFTWPKTIGCYVVTSCHGNSSYSWHRIREPLSSRATQPLCTFQWATDRHISSQVHLQVEMWAPWFLCPIRVHTANGIPIGSSVSAGRMVATNTHAQD